MFRSNLLRAAVALALCVPGAVAAQDAATLFAKEVEYSDARLSPTGEYVAVNTPDGEKRAISMIKLSGAGERNLFRFGGNEDRWGNLVKKQPIAVAWSDDERLIVFEGYDYGRFGSKFSSGNVYATDADASNQKQLFGYEKDSSNMRGRFKDEGSPFLMQLLPDSNGQALFYFVPWSKQNSKNTTQVFRVDTHTSKRDQIESFADNVTVSADNTGKARVNIRYDLNDVQSVQYRPTPESEWMPMPASLAGRALGVWFFDQDNNTAYAEISDKGEAAQLYRINMSAGTRERIGGQPGQEIASIARAGRLGPPVVLRYAAGRPKIDYVDPKSPWAQLHAGLMKAFPGQLVSFIDITKDDNTILVFVHSDRNPGTYYLFDRKNNKPTMLFQTREWIDPAKMAPMSAIEFKNRGGETLYGFLTTPLGKNGALPLIVVPHGGPYGVSDSWGFDSDTQFLASLGYAVLQVNYRGSGQRGDTFLESTYRQWGTGIQDDITDGVKHVIAQGLADPNKVCIFGASFGGYSAMMNPIRNPGMYKCAIGYAGVYDLGKMVAEDDGSKQSRAWLARAVGTTDAELAAQSPVNQIEKLDVPMLLIHGTSDNTAPIAQYKAAEAALSRAGKTFEKLIKANEGHGFYKEANRVEAYQRIQAFLLKYNPPN